MKPEPENKPLVGDDGELLTADPTVDPEVYTDSLRDPFPPPTLRERISYNLTNKPVLWGAVLLIIFFAAIASIPAVSVSVDPTPYASHMTPVVQTRAAATMIARQSWGMPDKGEITHPITIPNAKRVYWSLGGNFLAFQNDPNNVRIWTLGSNKITSGSFAHPALFAWSADGRLYLNTTGLQTGAAAISQPRLVDD